MKQKLKVLFVAILSLVCILSFAACDDSPISVKLLSRIEIAEQPNKTTYTVGDKFNPEGMVVVAHYIDGSFEEVTDYTYGTDSLKLSDTSVVISYSLGGVTKFASVNISVVSGEVVDAAVPQITAQPQDITAAINAIDARLIVVATVADEGSLSYQWYSNATDSNEGGTIIEGATSDSYSAPTSAEGTIYYYVVVTNTNNEVNGAQVASVKSDAAKVEIVAESPVVTAEAPSITAPLAAASALVASGGDIELSIAATSSDSGTISYELFVCDIDGENGVSKGTNTTGEFVIEGAPDDIYYFYVVVTNTVTNVNGTATATVSSSVVTVEVAVITNAAAPVIDTQPAGSSVDVGTAVTLSVVAHSADGGSLSYQWYSNSSASNTGGDPINLATGDSYLVPDVVGTYYFYVVVTNHKDVNGNKNASIASNAVTVVINAIVDAEEPTFVQPSNQNDVVAGNSYSITVSASVTDGGVLSYQWYSNNSASNVDGSVIDGATSATLTILSAVEGTHYYYVEVTNYKNVNGTDTVTKKSDVITVIVVARVDAVEPTFDQPSDQSNVVAGNSYSITVSASVTDGGELSYQWYSNNSASNENGSEISEATSATLTILSAVEGTHYYYVEVTNYKNVNGTDTVTKTSEVITVIVVARVDAEAPDITTNLTNITVVEGADSATTNLTIVATGSGTLSYQWYSNNVASEDGANTIGENSATLAVPIDVVGKTYYYVVITNTDTSVNGTKTAAVTSAIVCVDVIAALVVDDITGGPVETDADLTLTVTTSYDGVGGVTLTYQWYECDDAAGENAQPINGADEASYTVNISAEGTYYFYVVVSNGTEQVDSNVVEVVVSNAE